jgi:hypothetical protein
VKLTLKVESEYDFALIALYTHTEAYKLCWAMNRMLNMDFKKSSTPCRIPVGKKHAYSEHTCYQWYDEVMHTEYLLLRNKSSTGFLFPDHPKADYILMLRDNFNINITQLIKSLRNIENILMAAQLRPEDCKFADNLMFIELETN